MRCYVEPSPAGGYFVRLRGEPAPLSHHDTEEEAEAAAAAYERGLERMSELVVLPDGSEVLIRPLGDEEIGAFADGRSVGAARYVPDATRPHLASAAVVVDEVFRGRGLAEELMERLRARAAENGIRDFV